MNHRYLNQDENDYWADRRCLKCDRHLDRRGALCSECNEEAQERYEEVEKGPPAPPKESAQWEFLNDQFQKIFSRK